MYTSPLARCRQTAEILAIKSGHASLPLQTVEDFAEVDTGLWDGLPFPKIREQFPKLRAAMIGRGILRDPLLIRRITGAASANEASEGAAPEDTAKIKSFHDDLLEAYLAYYPDERQALSKMKELWWYMRDSFPDKEREIRKLRKSSRLAEYRSLEQTVFR